MKRALSLLGMCTLSALGLVWATRSAFDRFANDGRAVACEAQRVELPADAPVISAANVAQLDLVGVLCEPEVHGQIRAALFLPDETRLATSGRRQPVRIWSLATGRADALSEPGLYMSLASDPAGRWLVAGRQHAIDVWELETLAPKLSVARAHRGEVRGLAFVGPDRFASGGEDGRVTLWDVGSSTSLASARTGNSLWSLALRPDGAEIAAGGELFASRLRASDLGASARIDLANEPALSAAYARDGRLLLAGDGALRSFVGEQPAEALPIGESPPREVAVSPASALIAAGSRGELRFWDPERTNPVAVVALGVAARVEALAFSPSGRLLAAAGDGGGVYLFAVSDRQ
jgi:WD40 repeat protein